MRPAIAAAVAAVLAVAGCTTSHVDNPAVSAPPSGSITGTAGAPSTATSPGAPDPCALLTTAEVQTAFGGTAGNGAVPTPVTRPECDWSVTGSRLGAAGKVIVFYPSVQSSAAFNAAKSGLPGVSDVTGVGDDAFYEASLGALTVLVGDRQFTVQGDFHGAGAAALRADLTTLARIAATHF